MNTQIINIIEVKRLLQEGKKIKVKSVNGEFVPITDFIEKGILDTYKITLGNGSFIKCSANHKVFTNAGWVECIELLNNYSSSYTTTIPSKWQIFTDKGTYENVDRVEYIGKEQIYDITVDCPDHAYFAQGILHHNSGKSLIAAHLIADTQKKGGIGVYIDTENAASKQFLKAIGVDMKALIYCPVKLIEDCFEVVENIITQIRAQDKTRLVTIVIDSISGSTTKVEEDADFDKDGWSTAKAIIMSKALRKITDEIGKQHILLVCTSQLREVLSLMMLSADKKYTTSGGHALGFHSSVRVRLKNIQKLKTLKGKVEEIIGMRVEATVFKNRVGPPHRKAEFDVYFDSGIDDINSWYGLLKNYELIEMVGSYSTFPSVLGTKKFRESEWRELMEDPSNREKTYNLICEMMIMKYKDHIDHDMNTILREATNDTEQ